MHMQFEISIFYYTALITILLSYHHKMNLIQEKHCIPFEIVLYLTTGIRFTEVITHGGKIHADMFRLGFGEEVANCVTHGIMAFLCILLSSGSSRIFL